MTDAHDGAECIGTQTQMSILTHILKTLTLLLHRVVITAKTVKHDVLTLYFGGLTLCGTLNKGSLHADTCTGSYLLKQFGIYRCGINNNLYVLDCGAVVQRDEIHGFGTAVGTYPSFYADFLSIFGVF